MMRHNGSLLGPIRDGQRGQSLALVASALVVLLAMAALVVDLGEIYFSFQELQSATSAAALAGGGAIPNPSGPLAATVALQYSAVSGYLNNHPNLHNVSASVNLGCVSPSSYPNLGLPPCALYPSCPAGCNMIQVTQTAKVSTFFAQIFGVKTVNLSATATASAKGGQIPPYHIMMVLDATPSMGMGTDTGCTQNGTSVTPEECAQYGIQTLLAGLDPCSVASASCTVLGGSGTVLNPVDQVGLMVFPGLCSSTNTGITSSNCPTLATGSTLTDTIANTRYAPQEYACPSTMPPLGNYNNNPEYLVLPFQGNYRFSDSSGLNTGSNIFKSIGAGTNNCGLQTTGPNATKYTFYAGALQAAYDYLHANDTTGVQDIIIFLSDGDANASAATGDMAGNVKQVNGPYAGQTFASTNECQQAVNTGNWIKNQGVLIYSVSYGSETTGCSTDGAGSSTRTPCATMQGVASLPLSQYFFSVPNSAQAGGTICSNAVPITALNQVFTTIQGDLTVSRLVPNTDF